MDLTEIKRAMNEIANTRSNTVADRWSQSTVYKHMILVFQITHRYVYSGCATLNYTFI